MSEQLPFLISATNRPQIPVHDFVGRETEINSLVESFNRKDSHPTSSGVGKWLLFLARLVVERLNWRG